MSLRRLVWLSRFAMFGHSIFPPQVARLVIIGSILVELFNSRNVIERVFYLREFKPKVTVTTPHVVLPKQFKKKVALQLLLNAIGIVCQYPDTFQRTKISAPQKESELTIELLKFLLDCSNPYAIQLFDLVVKSQSKDFSSGSIEPKLIKAVSGIGCGNVHKLSWRISEIGKF